MDSGHSEAGRNPMLGMDEVAQFYGLIHPLISAANGTDLTDRSFLALWQLVNAEGWERVKDAMFETPIYPKE